MGNLRGNPIEIAQKFIERHFPSCESAILAGSVVRGEETETSDLDVVIFDKNISSSYRESVVFSGWPIEVFVHNLTSYKDFFQSDYERARPSMPRMVAEGIVLKDDGSILSIKEEAKKLLELGPKEWSEEVIKTKRYFITDLLDDFIGSSNRAEEIFIANELAALVSEFVLRTNRKWVGTSKWVFRSLSSYDEEFAVRFVGAFDAYYRTGEKMSIIDLVAEILRPHGGRLFAGYSLGKGDKDK